jgi:N-acetylglucosaminyldiphosphoundecaprenol N-acetyl-beta-D-mannosaminyltransferase
MNYEVFTEELNRVDINKRQVINTINPHSFMMAKEDKEFSKALHQSDILLPDGSGIVLAAKHIYNKKIHKIAGADLHDYLLKKMNEKSAKVFYMGASQDTLNKIKEKFITEYPNIIMESYSPPFKEEFSKEENQIIISKINKFHPDVLFVGMTAPKQEKWLEQYKEDLNFTIASSIGAVFDFYAGKVQRSSQFWINLHLEWLPRLIKEPKRLWKRNFISTPLFIINIIKYKLKV